MNRLLSAALAKNTHKTYARGWEMFCRFQPCHQNVTHCPANASDVRRFIGWLSVQNFAPATINTYVSAVGYYHKINGCSDPTHDFLVAKLLEGCRRSHPSRDCRQPISLLILKEICGSLPIVCSSQFEACMFKAVFLSAFFGLLRVGEFAADSKHKIQESVLSVSDVHFGHTDVNDPYVEVSLKHSKNNQAGPPQVIYLKHSNIPGLCPVTALKEFLQIRPTVSGPLFSHFDGSPLTRYQFNAVLRKALTFTTVSHENIRGHSFRIGAASTAALGGIPEEQIRSMGRWRSQAFLTYIRPVQKCAFHISTAHIN